MKLPLGQEERRLLRDLFDPRRVRSAFPHDTAEATRLHDVLAAHHEVDLPRADLEALTTLLARYVKGLAGPGVAVPPGAPLAETVALADHGATLQHIHAQLVRHLEATA